MSRIRIAMLSVVLVGTMALLATGASPANQTTSATRPADYGDAPDSSPAGYPGQVLGLLPALRNSNGPRHIRAGQLVLGSQADRERDSRQVNLDRLDDGFSVQLTSCAESTLRFTIDATILPTALKTPGHVAFLNAWFDFDRDGRWRGSSRCPSGRAAEHAVRNQTVPLASFAATPVQTVEVRITAGQQVRRIWYRASMTLDERFASSASVGRSSTGRPRTTARNASASTSRSPGRSAMSVRTGGRTVSASGRTSNTAAGRSRSRSDC